MMDTSCLYSTVVNASGNRMKFGFLPAHGQELADGEEFTIFGDIRELVGANAGSEPGSRRRSQVALESAISAGLLEILSTPAPIVQDTATSLPRMLQVTSGVLSAVAPCWYNSVSEVV